MTRNLAVAALLAALVFGAITLYALEGNEVVVLHTRGPDGTIRETRTWIGDEHGAAFIESAHAERPFYRHLLANPEVEVQVGTKKMTARARTAAGEERLRLWKKALEFWPPYADYQLKTEREIPVVVLDPVH